MFDYLVRRLLWAVGMFLAVTIFAFVTFWVIPVNRAALNGGNATPQLLRTREHLMGSDRPLPVQYARFVWNLVGPASLGHSLSNRRGVNQPAGDGAPGTASLVIGGA